MPRPSAQGRGIRTTVKNRGSTHPRSTPTRMGRQPLLSGGPSRTRCAESTMRSTSLSRVGADRTRTQVLAVANSQRPVSATTTVGGGAGRGAAGFGVTVLAGSADGAVRVGEGITAGVAAGTYAAGGITDADAARSDESNDASGMESPGDVTPVSAALTSGTCAGSVCSVRREIR